jgi:hypothetical protein
MSRGQRDGSLRPYSRFSRPELVQLLNKSMSSVHHNVHCHLHKSVFSILIKVCLVHKLTPYSFEILFNIIMTITHLCLKLYLPFMISSKIL